ncbi:MAG: T9SS type A sorting domain-containing protein [Flavobacteriales bacterium]|nr:T9SS type A sorting domain-containing protein [Flavobacteriales bacterium]
MKKSGLLLVSLFISVWGFAQTDLFFTSYNTPVSGVNLTSSEQVSVEIYNGGPNTVLTGEIITFYYSINGGAPVMEQFTLTSDLFAYYYQPFTFSTTADLSAYATYDIDVWLTYPNDTYTANDSSLNHLVINGSSPFIVPNPADTFYLGTTSNYFSFYGAGTDFLSYQSVYFIHTSTSDTLFPSITPPDFPDNISGYFDISCTKAVGAYDVYITTSTDGLLTYAGGVYVKNGVDLGLWFNNPHCHGENTGYASIYPYSYSGAQTFTVSWSTGDTVYNVNNLFPGTYTVDVTDANGCSNSGNFTLVDPPVFDAVLHKIDSDCGQNNGIAWVEAIGGTAPFDFWWDWFEYNGDTLSNIGPGSYGVTAYDVYGCAINLTANIFDALTLDVTSTSTTCGNPSAIANLTVLNGTSPYDITWSNGDIGFSADSLAPGLYQVIASDANSCQGSLSFQVTGTDAPNISNSVVNQPTCSTNPNGSIDLTITGGVAPFSFQWSNGTTTEDQNNLTPGTYQVIVTDATGCMVGQCFSINDQNMFRQDGYYAQLASCGLNDAEVWAYSFGGVQPVSYQWSANAGGQTTQNATLLGAGFYSVILTDATGCTDTMNVSVSSGGFGPYYGMDTYVNATCGGNDGEISITPQGGSGIYTSVVWDGTNNNEDLLNANSGWHTLSITDDLGCQGNYHVFLESNIVAGQDICLVTVDTLTGMNLVVWQKDMSATNIDHYNIYRETCELNGFEFVGAVDYDSLSQFIDYGANAMVQSWKYVMTAVDDCGNESDFSPVHKTIHLFADRTQTTSVDLSWDSYIGFGFTEQIIWRHHYTTGWVIIDTVPATQFTYTDVNTPNVDSSEYFIEVYAPATCVSDRAVNHNSTRSNRNTVAAPNNSSVGELLMEGNMLVYPNPSTGLFNLNLSMNRSEAVQVQVFDMSGKLVFNRKLNFNAGNSNYLLDLNAEGNGIYQVVITGSEQQFKSRIIKQ